MTPGLPLEPSKTHRDENFPVASTLIAPKHRSVILAYYRFARGADDVADSPSFSETVGSRSCDCGHGKTMVEIQGDSFAVRQMD